MLILENFKSFSHAEIDLTRPMTVLIGRNGSGKSNLAEAIELLAQIAYGRPLYEITDIGRANGVGFEIRGGIQGCPKAESNTIFGSFSMEFDGSWKGQEFSYYLLIGCAPEPRVMMETLYWGKDEIFNAGIQKREDILEVQHNNFRRNKKKPIIQLPSDRSVLSRYESFADSDRPNQKQKESFNLVRSVEQQLSSAFVLEPDPKLMRNYERIGQNSLTKNGRNLSSVLHLLDSGLESHRIVLDRILDRIKQLPDEQVTDFEFVTTRLNDVLFALKRPDGSLIDARLLSDGTLRALAVLTALEIAPENSRIIIEEMDNGIHPSRVKLLVDAIWEASHRRNLNVLITTHNPATLDSLSAEQLESVVLCYHDNEQNTSKLTPLLDLPRSDVLLERGRLGDLVTQRVLEQHLAPNFDEEQKQMAKAWLESIA